MRGINHYLKILSRFNKGGTNVVASDKLLKDQELVYVSTFEEKLVEYIKEEEKNNRIDLIIITGTAGDGKTVFLSKIKELIGSSINGRPVEINLDASHSEEPNQTQFNILIEFFKEYSNDSLLHKPKTLKLIAINTGMLMNFFKKAKENKKRYDWLEYYTMLKLNIPIQHEKPKKGKPVWRVLFIDLSLRDLFIGEESIFDRLIEQMYLKTVATEQCENCEFKSFCFLRTNLKILKENKKVRNKVKELFIKYEIEKNTHITMRLLLETLAFMIAGHYTKYKYQKCVDEIKEFYRKFEEEGDNSLFENLFYNRIFLEKEKLKEELVDLETLNYFRDNHPIFLSSKEWVQYMSATFANPSFEIDVLLDKMFPIEKMFFKKLKLKIQDLERELSGRENQNTKYIKEIVKELSSIKNEAFLHLLQRQYFFMNDVGEINNQDKNLKGHCFNEFYRIIKDLIKYHENQLETSVIERHKNVILERICKALSLSDNTSEILSLVNRRKNEIILQKKIAKRTIKPTIAILQTIEVDRVNSSISVSFNKDYVNIFPQLPLTINLNLKLSESGALPLSINFETYFFLYKLTNGYKPSKIDQQKNEEIELIKRKLIYLSRKRERSIRMIEPTGNLLTIRSNDTGTRFWWELE